MKTQRTLLLFAALLLAALLSGCLTQEPTPVSENMVSFYYRQSTLQYGTRNGVLSSELRSVVDRSDYAAWLNVYLRGPLSSELSSPFPKAVTVQEVSQSGACVRIVLSNQFSKLLGVDRTLANACLTLTLTQFDGVESVLIEVEDDVVGAPEAMAYSAADFAEFDYASNAVEADLRLYYSDRSQRYLLSTTVQVETDSGDHLPEYVVNRLIDGPQDEAMADVFPEGTKLLDCGVEDGVCTLNFDQAFFDGRPTSETAERVLIYSIVNSVTGISGIHAVRFEIEGEPAGLYYTLDLSREYTFNEAAVGPVREAMNELDCTVYLCGADATRLNAVPLRVRVGEGESAETALLEALLAYEPQDGLVNPIPDGVRLLSANTEGGVCYVNLSPEYGSAHSAAATHSIVLTLTASLSHISRVQIQVDGELCTSILLPNENWRYAAP